MGGFTSNIDLMQNSPPRDIPLRVLRIIEKAIRRGWALLLESGFNPNGMTEPLVTTELQLVLERLRTGPEGRNIGFTTAMFAPVQRGAEVLSFDRRSIEKRPDLLFCLCPGPASPTGSGLYEGLFVECKRIHRPHFPVGSYCTKGVKRFESGEYAWRMAVGGMVAYVSDDTTIGEHLITSLKRNQCAVVAYPDPEDTNRGWSTHHRNWVFPSTKRNPGDIRLLHIWLSGMPAES